MSDPKPVKKLSDLPEKHAALILLDDNGLTHKQKAKALNYKENSVGPTLSKLRKYTFTGNIKAQKKAARLINAFASGQLPANSDIEQLKCSTALGAAKYISDHNDPITKSADEGSGNQINNYTQIINVNDYRVQPDDPKPVKTIDSE